GAALGTGLLISTVVATILVFLYGRPFYNASPHPWPYAFFQSADALQPNHTFFVVGDWGRQGNQNQTNVASLMGQVADLEQPSFVISTGDNFYEHGLSSYDDPLFKESFTDVYNASGLQVPWHPDVNLASKDPRWICKQGVWRQSFGTTLDIVFIDTMPLLVGRTLAKYTTGGLGYRTSAIMRDTMEELLESSRAQFKIVVGHMPLRSFGEHGNYRETANECARLSFIEPILIKHKVDAYFAGHDHNLQLIRTDQIIIPSGRGGRGFEPVGRHYCVRTKNVPSRDA
ncbi:Metallo-dependent phosphatase-like protein, partial [Dunaliella salina]